MANNNYTFYNNRKVDSSSLFNNDVKGVPEDGTIDLHTLTYKTTYPGLVFGIGLPVSVVDKDDFNIGINLDYVSGCPVYPSSSVKGVLRSVYKNKKFVKEIFKTELNDDDINQLETELFAKQNVVFFNAIIKRNKAVKDELIKDFLTPHKEPTKEPTPIKMIRIPEDSEVIFRFFIKDVAINEKTIYSNEILNSFDKTILYVGIGAKTNVGYGNLIGVKE